MEFKVIAKRYGDSVEFSVVESTTKAAFQEAKTQANDIFGFKAGEAAPTVSVKPVPEED